MSTAGIVLVDIQARMDALQRDLQRAIEGAAEKGAKSMQQKLEAAGKKLESVGKKLTIGITAPIAAFGVSAFNAASDLNESLSKVGVVFGDQAGAIEAWSKTAATAFGQSQQQALEAAGTFGNLFTSMGVGNGPAADMSKSLVQLAGDLASFNNANPQDVLDALRSGLSGETEPLKRFGIAVNQARIEAEALRLGLVKGNVDMTDVEAKTIAVAKAQAAATDAAKKYGDGSLQAQEAANKVAQAEQALSDTMAGKVPELTAAQKLQATYSLVMQDTATAQGDFARTADGAANKQRILTAKFKDASAQLGQKLLPIGEKLIGWVTTLVDKFGNLSPHMQDIIFISGGLAAALGPVLTIGGKMMTLFAKIPGVISGVSKAFTALSANPWMLAIAAIAVLALVIYQNWDKLEPLFRAVGEWFADVGRKIGEIAVAIGGAFADAWNWVVDSTKSAIKWIGNAIQWVIDLPSKIGQAFLRIVDAVWGAIKSVVNAFSSGINMAIRFINALDVGIPDWMPVVGGYTLGFPDIPQIPMLADGGPLNARQLAVVGERGPELFAARSAGQVISNEQLARALGGGDAGRSTVNYYITNPISEQPSVTVAREQRRNSYRTGAL